MNAPRRLVIAGHKSFLALAVMFTVVLGWFGWLTVDNREHARTNRLLIGEVRRLTIEGQQAHAGLCAIRNDYARRVKASRDFLDQNPNGIPGIPAFVLTRSIRDQDRTVDTIDTVVNCPREEPR